MAGRQKERVYVYYLNGKFKESFDSQTDFRNAYFKNDIGKRPILTCEERIITPRHDNELIRYNIYGDVIIFGQRIYRDDVVYLVKIHNSEFCKKSDESDNKEIEVLNIKNEVIATFKNKRLLSKAMPHIPEPSIFHQLEYGKRLKKFNSVGLLFRYKKK